MSEARCSALAALAGEAMAGTAPHATGWVALEQNGPWGARAFTASHLDAQVGAEIERRCAEHELRPCLIRRPGRHPDCEDDERTVLVSHGLPGRSWLLRGSISDPATLLALDWAAVRAGDLDAVRASLPELEIEPRSHLLVCTNGTRDLCCALEGRPVAEGLRQQHPDRVWETTHTSGHRFAPTAVELPSGHLHGRLDVDAALEVIEAADRGETVIETSRGRCCWPDDAQAAEHAVRRHLGEARLDALTVRSLHDGAGRRTVVVDHADGRSWRLEVRRTDSGATRPESCGKAPVSMSQITVSIEEMTAPSR